MIDQMCKKANASSWTAEDTGNWNNHLNDDERHFVPHVLCLLATSDGIVNEILVVECFSDEVQAVEALVEARYFYSFESMSTRPRYSG
jgi:ribonucleoside-diphosphate reductase subunit M2